MRRLATLAVLLAVVLAGCAAPTADRSPTADPSGAAPAATTSGDGTAVRATGERPDPDGDVQGWENGRWYDERLGLTPGDGYDDSELSALVARTMARVEHVRGVEFERDVAVTVRTRSELGGGNGGGGGEAGIEGIRSRALFLVGDGGNASQAASETRQASVQGSYSPRRDEIVVVSPTETPRVDESTLAHELVHAYQFRQRSLTLPRSPSDDAITALRALIEGEANLVERLYDRRCRANWSCARPDGEGAGVGDEGGEQTDESGNGSAAGGGASVHMGLYLRALFPYGEGEELVTAAYERDGWDGVDALFEDPPRSTEQVIHPETADRLRGVRRVPDRSTDDWRRVTASRDRDAVVVGEDGLATMFIYTAYDDRPGAVVPRERFLNRQNGSVDPADPLDYDVNYSAGWGGDALAGYSHDGETASVWRLRWDDAGEAREFVRGYRRLLTHRGGERVATDGAGEYWRLSGPFAGGYYVVRDGRTVTVVHAPSVDALGDVWAPAGRDEADGA
jgi:hypothetical protein